MAFPRAGIRGATRFRRWRRRATGVAAPDVRGYGGSDKPHAIEAYAIKDMAADIDGLIAALGADRAVVVGHDWGAPIAYGTALFHPERVRGVAGLSAPHTGRGSAPERSSSIASLQGPLLLSALFPGARRGRGRAGSRCAEKPAHHLLRDLGEGQKAAAGSKIRRAGLARSLRRPGSVAALADRRRSRSLRREFRAERLARAAQSLPQLRAGFRTACPLRRQADRAPTASWPESRAHPALRSRRRPGRPDAQAVRRPSLVRLFEDAGHWVQQERPAEVNAALLEFQGGL